MANPQPGAIKSTCGISPDVLQEKHRPFNTDCNENSDYVSSTWSLADCSDRVNKSLNGGKNTGLLQGEKIYITQFSNFRDIELFWTKKHSKRYKQHVLNTHREKLVD